MIEVAKAFNTLNSSVYDYYQRQGVGFYIPLYQREYSWDNDNIEQLLEDISKGIENIKDDEENEIRFLGTIITVTETDTSKIDPQDPRGLPSCIEKIIDGQQRLSSISLLSALLVRYIKDINGKINKPINKLQSIDEQEKENLIGEISEISKYWSDRLYDIFSVDLKRGKPNRKPKIIRESVDKWVLQELYNSSYNSPVTHYLYSFINCYFEDKEFPKFDVETNAGKNLKTSDTWIRKSVLRAHINNDGFLPAQKILTSIKQENIWQYERDNIVSLINENDYMNENSFSYVISSFVQLLSVCHFLLDRCCFTIIKPINDDWAFDMFQSLNATGTPLTAIETFKPLIVNTLKLEKQEFKNSLEDKYFNKIEQTFADLKSAQQKNKMTNELLTSIFLPLKGSKLATHFSSQRKELEKIYTKDLREINERRDFLKFFGNYSEFYKEVWREYKAENSIAIRQISNSNEAELASLLMLYLKDADHKMAITVLGSMFSNVTEGVENSVSNFISTTKLIAAFYTIWRSAKSNAGLDDAYRSFFKGIAKENIIEHNWIKDRSFDLNILKNHFQSILEKEEINTKEKWIEKSVPYLKYGNALPVCKFVLFISSHDTIPDENTYGVMKEGTNNCNPFLKLEKWTSSDFKSLEHIAPVKKTESWSQSLYEDNQLYDSIGNLTLLPLSINISASNKGWKEKYIYYRHLGLKDPDKIKELQNKAISENILLSEDTLNLLKSASYSHHIEHITKIGENGSWDAEIVKKRTRRILGLLWDKVAPWILS